MEDIINGPARSRGYLLDIQGGFVIKEVAYSNFPKIIFVNFAAAILSRWFGG